MFGEQRARELMLNPNDKAAYLTLVNGERGEYTMKCAGCGKSIQTYESDILKHVRTCEQLRSLSQGGK